MRSAFRFIMTIAATILGAGTISPLVGANWQEWAKANGQDQYLVKYAGPYMDRLTALSDSWWFTFATGFFVGGAVCLWIDYLIRRRSHQQPKVFYEIGPVATKRMTAAEMAHGLHMNKIIFAVQIAAICLGIWLMLDGARLFFGRPAAWAVGLAIALAALLF
jgi:hypothetical protein